MEAKHGATPSAIDVGGFSSLISLKARSFLDKYEYSLELVDKYTETLLNEEELDGLELRFNVNNFVENLLGMYQEFLEL